MHVICDLPFKLFLLLLAIYIYIYIELDQISAEPICHVHHQKWLLRKVLSCIFVPPGTKGGTRDQTLVESGSEKWQSSFWKGNRHREKSWV